MATQPSSPTSPAPTTPPPAAPPKPPQPTPPPAGRHFELPLWLGWVGLVLLLAVSGFFLFFWRGTITITAEPAGATVTLADTTSVGSVTKSVAPGTYHVGVHSDGYIPFDGEVRVSRDEDKVATVQLRPLPTAVRVGDQPIQFMVQDFERESLLFLEPGSATIFRLSLSDPAKPIKDAITPGVLKKVSDFLWSPNRQLAFFKDETGLKQYDFNRYDLVNQEIRDWPGTVGSIQWRPDGERVVYVFADPATGERTLVRATKDNTELERIYNLADTPLTDPELVWSPDGKTLAIWQDALYKFDVFTKELTKLELEEPVVDVRWSPTSGQLLYETAAGQLGLVNLDGTVTKLDLQGPLTRTAFTNNGSQLIAAQGRGANLVLGRHDLATGTQVPLAQAPSSDLNPDHLLLGPDDGFLYFTSAGLPYVLKLDDGRYPPL